MGQSLSWNNIAFIYTAITIKGLYSQISSCSSYTDVNGQSVAMFSCDGGRHCCGNSTSKYCCTECDLAIDEVQSCHEQDWDPTSTIVQGVLIGVIFITFAVVGTLAFNGNLDAKPMKREGHKREFMPTPINPAKGYPVQPAMIYPSPSSNDLITAQTDQPLVNGYSTAQNETQSSNPGSHHVIMPEIVNPSNVKPPIMTSSDLSETPSSAIYQPVTKTRNSCVVSVKPVDNITLENLDT